MPSLADDLRTAPATYRPFRTDPFPPGALRRAGDRAHLAPWRLVAITDPDTRRAIRDAHLPHWHAHLVAGGGLKVLADDRPALVARDLRAADAFAGALHEAPVHLVVLGRRAGTLRPGLLAGLRAALHAEEVDAAPLPMADAVAPELHRLLELPEDLVIAGVLVLRNRR